ncbi:MAG: anti-sigma factor antagonist [Rhodocyclales bacterium GT-UBC]|nr:MAG: anti-sigma factor antagonist [Rhodocyclales bacterium GT-UBC]
MASPHHPTTNASSELRLEMPARLDFDAARKLIAHAQQCSATGKYARLCLDFRKTQHLDTAGLGSLLVVAEHFGVQTQIEIEGAVGMVRQLLDMACLDEVLAHGKACSLDPTRPRLAKQN